MNLKKKYLYIIIACIAFSCNKTKEKMKNILYHEEPNPFKEAGIDTFYYYTGENGVSILPLIKPYYFYYTENNCRFGIEGLKSNLNITMFLIDSIDYFDVFDIYIYGHNNKDENDPIYFPERWFIVDTKAQTITFFETEIAFKQAVKELNLPEIWRTPEEVYEQYRYSPELPWFPENINKQLEEIRLKNSK